MQLGLSDQAPSTPKLSSSLPSLGYVLAFSAPISSFLFKAKTTRQQERHWRASDNLSLGRGVSRIIFRALVTLGDETSSLASKTARATGFSLKLQPQSTVTAVLS